MDDVDKLVSPRAWVERIDFCVYIWLFLFPYFKYLNYNKSDKQLIGWQNCMGGFCVFDIVKS